MTLAALYESSGIRSLVRRSGLLKMLPGLEHLEGQLPSVKLHRYPDRPIYRPAGAVKHRVALLSGCVMPYMYGRVNRATVEVLLANGCEVHVPPTQGCCGALQAHAGDLTTARELARRNIDAFLETQPEAIIINSAGCGAAMKEYGDLLHNDPVYREKAERFASLCRDISEYLVEIGLEKPQRPLPLRVTYQDSCHLGHAQRIRSQPREVLKSIPGINLVEMPAAAAAVPAFTARSSPRCRPRFSPARWRMSAPLRLTSSPRPILAACSSLRPACASTTSLAVLPMWWSFWPRRTGLTRADCPSQDISGRRAQDRAFASNPRLR
jgi:hypothetical protein